MQFICAAICFHLFNGYFVIVCDFKNDNFVSCISFFLEESAAIGIISSRKAFFSLKVIDVLSSSFKLVGRQVSQIVFELVGSSFILFHDILLQ